MKTITKQLVDEAYIAFYVISVKHMQTRPDLAMKAYKRWRRRMARFKEVHEVELDMLDVWEFAHRMVWGDTVVHDYEDEYWEGEE